MCEVAVILGIFSLIGAVICGGVGIFFGIIVGAAAGGSGALMAGAATGAAFGICCGCALFGAIIGPCCVGASLLMGGYDSSSENHVDTYTHHDDIFS